MNHWDSDIADVLAGRKRWTVITADCLAVLPTIPAGSVDAVVTDPPYAIPTNVAQGRTVTRNIGDLSLIESVFKTLFNDVSRLIKEQGRGFVFCDGTSYPVVFRAAYGRFQTALLVWDKGQIGMGREFRKSHELIMHCWRSETPIHSDGVGRADVIRVAPVSSEKRDHPAEKPGELLANLLRVCGPVVFDPFAGSGSTGEAAMRSGRRFIGIEIDPTYADIARRRITEAANHLFAGVPNA